MVNPDSKEYSDNAPVSEVLNGKSFTLNPSKDLVIKSAELDAFRMTSDLFDCGIFRDDSTIKTTLARNGNWVGTEAKANPEKGQIDILLSKAENTIRVSCVVKNSYFSGRTNVENTFNQAKTDCDARGGNFRITKESKSGLMLGHLRSYTCDKQRTAAYSDLKDLLSKNGLNFSMRNQPEKIAEEILGGGDKPASTRHKTISKPAAPAVR